MSRDHRTPVSEPRVHSVLGWQRWGGIYRGDGEISEETSEDVERPLTATYIRFSYLYHKCQDSITSPTPPTDPMDPRWRDLTESSPYSLSCQVRTRSILFRSLRHYFSSVCSIFIIGCNGSDHRVASRLRGFVHADDSTLGQMASLRNLDNVIYLWICFYVSEH